MQMKVPFKENVCLVYDVDSNVANLLPTSIMFLTQLFSMLKVSQIYSPNAF